MMKRYATVIKVKPEKLDRYKELHANTWPEIIRIIKECNIQNYSIYYRDGLLFSYFEYTGDDYDADMAKMSAYPIAQKWWDACMPCQEPLDTLEPGQWWADMEEVFHQD